MPKVGDYSYPDLDPEEAIDIAKTLVDKFDGSPNSEDAFAQSIGHQKASGGAYRSKTADLRKYGLIGSRGIEATELAKKIESPRDKKEEMDAKVEMMENIGLLDRLFEKLNGEKPAGDLWVILQEVTGCERKEAQKHEDKISKLYNKLLDYNRAWERAGGESEEMKTKTSSTSKAGNTPEGGLYINIDGAEIKLPEVSNDNIDLAINYLESQKDEEEN